MLHLIDPATAEALLMRQAAVARDAVATCDPLIEELMQLRHDFRFTPELAGRIDALINIARRQ